MNVLMVYAYQDPQSFGAALHSRAVRFFEGRGDQVTVSDLYASGFHAVAEKWDFKVSGGAHADYALEQKRVADAGLDGFAEDIQDEIKKLRAADMVILEFPTWWHAPPAIMKGWIDKVFALGVVHDSNHHYKDGFMRGKQAMVITSVSDPETMYSSEGPYKATLGQYLYPLLHGTLAQTGFSVTHPYIVYNTMMASKDEQQKKIDELGDFVKQQVERPTFLYRN